MPYSLIKPVNAMYYDGRMPTAMKIASALKNNGYVRIEASLYIMDDNGVYHVVPPDTWIVKMDIHFVHFDNTSFNNIFRPI